MNTAVLADGLQYVIPNSDIDFFKQLAKKMGWVVYKTTMTSVHQTESSSISWTDEFVGKWQDGRTTDQMLQDIHDARTANDNVTL